MLGFIATDAAVSRRSLDALVRAGGAALVQLHHGGRRYLDQRLLHADRDRHGRRCRRSSTRTAPNTRRCADARDRGGRRAGAGHRARRRGRDQVHHRARRRRAQRGGVPQGRATPSRIRRWSRPHSSPPIPTSAASSPRSAMPASPISTCDKVDLYLDDVLVAKNGGRNPGYREADGQRVMKQARSPCASCSIAAARRRRCGPAICRTTT